MTSLRTTFSQHGFPKTHRRFGLAVLVHLVGALVAAAAVAQSGAPVDTLGDGSVIFSYRGGEQIQMTPEEKIAELNMRLRKNPADAKGWNDLGVIYARMERYDVARDAFINAVQAAPTEGDYHRNLGLVFSRLEMFDMAVAEFEAYRRYDAMGGRDFWRLIGGAQIAAGQPDAARQTYQEGLEMLGQSLGPEGLRLVMALHKLETDAGNESAVRDLLRTYMPAAREYLATADEQDEARPLAEAIVHNRVAQMVEDGKLMEQSGLLAEAADMYKQAYEIEPTRDDLLPRLVDVYIKAGELMEAKVTSRLARDEHPDKAGTWIAVGRIYEQENRLDDAVDAYRKAFAIDDSIDDLRVAIGNLLIRLGRDEEAAEFLKAGVNQADTKPEVVYNYAVSQIRAKKYHAAIASLRTVVKQRPEMFAAWSALAQCLRVTKQYSAAIEPYRRAMALQPDEKLAYNLGICAARAKQYTTAIDAYEQALAMNPRFVEARYNLSLAYSSAGRYDEAIASFDLLLEMEPDSYRAYYSQGLAYYYSGDYDNALERFDMALELKETANVLNNIGLVYDKLGKKKEAQKYYKLAKEL